MKYNIILASQSPRRKELLKRIIDKFEIIPSMADESVDTKNPEEAVRQLALKKGEEVFERIDKDKNILVIGADTIVVNNAILGKPKDREDAIEMIKNLSGKSHYVYTAVSFYIYNNETKENLVDSLVEKTEVKVSNIDIEEIEKYVDTKDCFDKAGGYGIQGQFGKYISGIVGDYYNVVGFPLNKVYEKIKKIGVDF